MHFSSKRLKQFQAAIVLLTLAVSVGDVYSDLSFSSFRPATTQPVVAALTSPPKKPSRRRMKRSVARTIRPSWADPRVCQSTPNGTYLSDTDSAIDFTDPVLRGRLMGEKQAGAIRQEYELANREYELRRMHGQFGFQRERAYGNRVSGIGSSIASGVRDAQIRERVWSEKDQARMRGHLKDAAESETGRSVAGPIAVITTLTAVSTGEPVQLKLQDDAEVIARTDVRTKSGALQLHSQLFDTNIGYNDVQNERYRLSLGRPLPVWGLHSGLAYGGSSNLISASLSKEIFANLIATLNSSHLANTSRFDANRPAEESLLLNYQLRF